jgi:hypothetical protein
MWDAVESLGAVLFVCWLILCVWRAGAWFVRWLKRR